MITGTVPGFGYSTIWRSNHQTAFALATRRSIRLLRFCLAFRPRSFPTACSALWKSLWSVLVLVSVFGLCWSVFYDGGGRMSRGTCQTNFLSLRYFGNWDVYRLPSASETYALVNFAFLFSWFFRACSILSASNMISKDSPSSNFLGRGIFPALLSNCVTLFPSLRSMPAWLIWIGLCPILTTLIEMKFHALLFPGGKASAWRHTTLTRRLSLVNSLMAIMVDNKAP